MVETWKPNESLAGAAWKSAVQISASAAVFFEKVHMINQMRERHVCRSMK